MILQHVLHVGYIILGSGSYGGEGRGDYTQRGRFGDYLYMGELKANKQRGIEGRIVDHETFRLSGDKYGVGMMFLLLDD